jgi:predicted phage terminase large subunit-like protein
MDFVATCAAVRSLTARWPQAAAKYVEDKANGTAVINMLRHTVAGLLPVEPEGSKVSRAAAVSPLIEAGNVHVPAVELAPWVDDLIEEAVGFPRAKHDDRVDAMSQALNRLLINPLIFDDEIFEDDDAEQSISLY